MKHRNREKYESIKYLEYMRSAVCHRNERNISKRERANNERILEYCKKILVGIKKDFLDIQKVEAAVAEEPPKGENTMFRIGPFPIRYCISPYMAVAKVKIDTSVFSVEVMKDPKDEHHCVITLRRNGQNKANIDTGFGKAAAFHCAVKFMKQYIRELASGHGKGRGSWIKAKIAKYEREKRTPFTTRQIQAAF